MDNYRNGVNNIIAGTTYASLSTIVGFPFDTVKIKLQNKDFHNSKDAFWGIIRNEGFSGFYKGGLISLGSHISKRPLQFSFSEYMKKEKFLENTGLAKNFLIGILSGIIISPVATPFQVLKVRKQTGIAKKKIIKDFFYLYRTSGIFGIYRGFIPTVTRDCLFSMGLIGFYYTLRDTFGTGVKNIKVFNKDIPVPLDFFSGSFSYCFTWSLLMPIDFIKTNIQKSNSNIKISTIISKNYQKGGLSIFWRGLLPTCIKTFPVSGIAMTGYEYTRNKLEKI